VLMDRKQILASFPNLASMLGVRLFIVMKEVIEVYFSFFFVVLVLDAKILVS